MGDCWHWNDMGKKIAQPPKIFHVSWFRTDDDGNLIWPGFGENMRVLMLDNRPLRGIRLTRLSRLSAICPKPRTSTSRGLRM